MNLGDILDSVFTSNVFTICAWVKMYSYTDHNSDEGMIAQKWYTSGNTANSFILRPCSFITQGGGISVPKEDVPLDEWVFVTAVMDNGDMYLYNNGILVASGTGGYCNSTSYALRIGNLWNNHYDFDGLISHVMIFEQALPQATIAILHCATRIIPD